MPALQESGAMQVSFGPQAIPAFPAHSGAAGRPVQNLWLGTLTRLAHTIGSSLVISASLSGRSVPSLGGAEPSVSVDTCLSSLWHELNVQLRLKTSPIRLGKVGPTGCGKGGSSPSS